MAPATKTPSGDVAGAKQNYYFQGTEDCDSFKEQPCMCRIIRLSSVAGRFHDSIVTFQKALRRLGILRKRCAFCESPDGVALSGDSQKAFWGSLGNFAFSGDP